MAEATLLVFDGANLIPDDLPIVGGDGPIDKVFVQGMLLAAFDDTDEEACFAPCAQMPAGYAGTGTLKATLHLRFASEVTATNEAVFDVSVEAVTPGDALDLDAGRSFDSVNSGEVDPPGTAGYMVELVITLTNKDSVAAGDHVVFHIRRDCDAAADTATGDVYLESIRIHEDS